MQQRIAELNLQMVHAKGQVMPLIDQSLHVLLSQSKAANVFAQATDIELSAEVERLERTINDLNRLGSAVLPFNEAIANLDKEEIIRSLNDLSDDTRKILFLNLSIQGAVQPNEQGVVQKSRIAKLLKIYIQNPLSFEAGTYFITEAYRLGVLDSIVETNPDVLISVAPQNAPLLYSQLSEINQVKMRRSVESHSNSQLFFYCNQACAIKVALALQSGDEHVISYAFFQAYKAKDLKEISRWVLHDVFHELHRPIHLIAFAYSQNIASGNYLFDLASSYKECPITSIFESWVTGKDSAEDITPQDNVILSLVKLNKRDGLEAFLNTLEDFLTEPDNTLDEFDKGKRQLIIEKKLPLALAAALAESLEHEDLKVFELLLQKINKSGSCSYLQGIAALTGNKSKAVAVKLFEVIGPEKISRYNLDTAVTVLGENVRAFKESGINETEAQYYFFAKAKNEFKNNSANWLSHISLITPITPVWMFCQHVYNSNWVERAQMLTLVLPGLFLGYVNKFIPLSQACILSYELLKNLNFNYRGFGVDLSIPAALGAAVTTFSLSFPLYLGIAGEVWGQHWLGWGSINQLGATIGAYDPCLFTTALCASGAAVGVAASLAVYDAVKGFGGVTPLVIYSKDAAVERITRFTSECIASVTSFVPRSH